MQAPASTCKNSQRTSFQISVVPILFLLAFILPAMLFAQGYFGTVSGVLTDPSGAVIQGAKVTLQDEQKGYKFAATSDSDGRYLFASIPPGTYSVTAEMQGFEKTVRTHIKLNVSENPTANLTMKIAGAAQTVEVQAQSSTIATEDAVTGQVIDRRLINDLPLIDRNVTELTFLTPGVTDVDDQCHNCGSTNFASNGSRGASADILSDGASITNFEPNGGVTKPSTFPRRKQWKSSRCSRRISARNTAFRALRFSTWSRDPARMRFTAACMTSFATRSRTQTTGSTIAAEFRFRPFTGTTSA